MEDSPVILSCSEAVTLRDALHSFYLSLGLNLYRDNRHYHNFCSKVSKFLTWKIREESQDRKISISTTTLNNIRQTIKTLTQKGDQNHAGTRRNEHFHSNSRRDHKASKHQRYRKFSRVSEKNSPTAQAIREGRGISR